MRNYDSLLKELSGYLADARKASARAVNSVMTATYWLVGRRIVEFEQGGKDRAAYGEALLERLSTDLTSRFGRGFSRQGLQKMRAFHLGWEICPTVSGKLQARVKHPTLSGESTGRKAQVNPGANDPREKALSSKSGKSIPADAFSLPWSHYVRLLSVDNPKARAFYETEALRGGWSVRQLDRQVSSLFYERTAMSKDKAAMLRKGGKAPRGEEAAPEEEFKDPLVLEFLGLKDEYSESDLEEALIRQLEAFLMELGGDFAFVGRQKRLRVGGEWYRVDLLFFHRKLRCLVVIDLKVGKFTHADAGQMHLYLNYARQNWVRKGENPPVGLILCAEKDEAVAKYALEGLPNKVMAAEYRMALPDEDTLAGEIMKTQRLMESRALYRV
jgi:predicted nuclease of restriction endonuclease-like (RecB) superfamily